MKLVSAKVGPFKSINSPQTVAIDPEVTVLVGMNEAGKTVFLQALEKSRDALKLAKFIPVDDYPRKDMSVYLKQHKNSPAEVAVLTYRPDGAEVREINELTHAELPPNFALTFYHDYANESKIGCSVEESATLAFLGRDVRLSSDAKTAMNGAASLRDIPSLLKDVSLTDGDKKFLAEIEARINKAGNGWTSIVSYEVFQALSKKVPRYLYFGEYDILPSKMNLSDLATRVEHAKSDPKHLQPQHRAVLALLRMADISVTDFTKSGGYEALKAKIEGVSIRLTDQIMEFWKQNEDLEVEVDIKPDPEDEAPFNNGANLYLRIKNRRHRGISTPFQQRSRGFIWFFSFLVWFDSVQHQIDTAGKTEPRDLVLLLDEPGLALHAMAQADFLRYIDALSKRHQVIYTTHSPFMVHTDRLHQVRVVEDQPKIGTVISSNVASSDPRTIFPLQAALGWTIAQNLFVSERNLLVEGPSELIYLKTISSLLEATGHTGLRDDITIVPVGGLDKVVTFVALLGASGLKLAVLHDYRGVPEQKLIDLVKDKMISQKAVLNASQFRNLDKLGQSGQPSDIEDLFEASTYLGLFNKAHAGILKGQPLQQTDILAGDRIVDRLERTLSKLGIHIRPGGGFNHYTVASQFASNSSHSVDDVTLKRFEALFLRINALL